MIISTLRTILLYIVIIIAIRIMGKRQISEMQTSELVITLLMSNIASIPMQDTDQSMLSGIIPIMVLLVCEISISYLMLKRTKIRSLICGKPVIIIDNGKIDRDAMIQLRISTEDMYEQLRQKDIFDIKEVAYAIIETNGKLSVMKKPENDTVTVSDMKIKAKEKPLQVSVISDGEISKSSLRYCGFQESYIQKVLKKESTALSDVFIMTMDKNGSYNIIKKEK
ncbi:MAG: DUF421 domain-containing protein [Clostridia bacterium]|nr:DUF421 domain-containing protein [Clostridia bacterium]